MPRTSKNAWRQTELEVLRAIKKLGAASLRSIGEEINLDKRWVGCKVILLRKAGRLYISGWEKKHLTGPSRPLFSIRLNKEEDEPAPIPQTDVQKVTAYRARKKFKELFNHA